MKRAKDLDINVPPPGATTSVAYEYRNDINKYVRDVLGVNPRQKQKYILDKLLEEQRVAVRSPRGYGKSALASFVVLWAISTFPTVKILTTAPSWTQVKDFLWREIRLWAAQADWNSIGLEVEEDKQLMTKRLEIDPNRVAMGLSPARPEFIEGQHSKVVVVIIDEAKTLDDEVWDAIEGTFASSEEFYYLAISTPGRPMGRFYDIHSQKPGYEHWFPVHITEEDARRDLPNFNEWADTLKKQWGEDSTHYRWHIKAEFAQESENALFPLDMLENAVRLWNRLSKVPKSEMRYKAIGADIGGSGKSETVLAKLYEYEDLTEVDDEGNPVIYDYVSFFEAHKSTDPDENVNIVANAIQESQDDDGSYTATAIVDANGIGNHVAEQVKSHRGLPAKGIHVGTRTSKWDKDRTGLIEFVNQRAMLFWRLREKLIDGTIALPDDDQLIGELSSLEYKQTAAGKYKVESKDDFQRRLGRSPDRADALSLTMYDNDKGIKKMTGHPSPFYS